MIKYKLIFKSIKKVEIEKQTDKFVCLKNGTRDAKIKRWSSYYDSLDEAKQSLISEQQKIITSALKLIADAEKIIENTQKITEDDIK